MDFFDSDNFNAQEIAEEAEHLQYVLGCMREQIELLKNDGFAYRIVDIYDENDVEEYRTDKFRHDERMHDIKILENSLSTPYFSRMKLLPIGRDETSDAPSMTRKRSLSDGEPLSNEVADIYVGANVIFHKGKIIVYSHNSPLGNRVYDRFENGRIEYGGYVYKVIFRRKFDIRDGKLCAVFQDYSAESGGVVYDKFLAHMLKVKRGDKRLTDIIPTIQSNQNEIITRPADENCVVAGCAGCGKTMILLQRLEYLGFNRKLDLQKAVIIAPSKRYIEHIQPVVDDLMINAARRMTMAELYRELLLSMHGIKNTARKAISAEASNDDGIDAATLCVCYGDELKRKLITALQPVKQSYIERCSVYRAELAAYENEVAAYGQAFATAVKPHAPVVAVDLKKLKFIPDLGGAMSKCKLYLLLTAYCYILGKPSFDCALFIDEGQDYFANEYKIIAQCTRATVNIYGDENQQVSDKLGIGNFDKLSSLWDVKRYSLNENYRNAQEITAYVNALLGMEVTSLGLDGGAVKNIGSVDLEQELKSVGDDRVAVIYSPNDVKTEAYLKKSVPSDILYTVVQSKGMEYERVYACGEMTEREKYVAYTRALDKLFICNGGASVN